MTCVPIRVLRSIPHGVAHVGEGDEAEAGGAGAGGRARTAR
jgi:hypothetical protein